MKNILALAGLLLSVLFLQWMPSRAFLEKGVGLTFLSEKPTYVKVSDQSGEKIRQGKFLILGQHIQKGIVSLRKEILLADWKHPDKLFILDMTGHDDEYQALLILQSLDVEEEDGEVTKIIAYSKRGTSYTKEYKRFKKPRRDIVYSKANPELPLGFF